MSVFQSGQPESVQVLQITPDAAELILEARDAEGEPERLALYVEVNGEKDGAYTYDMWFEAVADASPRDVKVEVEKLTVVVAAQSIELIRGATLDVGDEGLQMLNPNAPTPPPSSYRPAPESDLSSWIEIAVLEILEAEINPQIAMHGGRADLVAVEGGTAFLRLSGGCQGCGMAAVTLSQGITVAIQEKLPEITEIIDVTAHEFGENPYFEQAKK